MTEKVIFFLQKNTIMIIIMCIILNNYDIIMKKILSLLLGLFIVLLLGAPNILLAQSGVSTSWRCYTWVWQWCMSIGKIIWIEDEQPDYTPKSIAQDVVMAATYMVWTVLTIVIMYCGLMYIFASRDGKEVSTYKKWLISAAIWALLVWWAYAIVRLIQYIARS